MNKNIDIEFFNTAQLDIDSAKTLLDGAHFPQAIFSVQQCLEKTWKAIGLDSSFIGIQDLKKGGGHNFGTLFMKILKSGSGIANLNKHAPDQNQSNLESSFIQKIIENSIEDMKKFEQGFITLSDSDKMELLEMITKEPLKDSYQNFATLSDVEIKLLLTNVGLSNSIDQQISDGDLNRFKVFYPYLLNYLSDINVLFYAGLLFQDTAINSRYPSEHHTPSDLYNSENILVQKLPLIIDKISEAINGVINFNNLKLPE